MDIPIIKPYITEKEIQAVKKVLQSGWLAQGKKVAEFEQKVAEFEGVKHAIATTSCTTALHLTLAAMDLKTGYDVLVPSFTFVATANAVEYTGATAVLVDVYKETYCIDTDKLKAFIEKNYCADDKGYINKKTNNILWGIIPVNEFGLCCNIKKVIEIAKKYNLQIVEDSACALGASIDGVHEGAFGNISCLSFHPRKSITTGEGGMILCNDEKMAERIRQLRSHSASISEVQRNSGKGYLLPEYNELGYNYRLTDIQGAIGTVQMEHIDYIIEQRRKWAKRYDELLSKKVEYLTLPYEPKGYYHTYQSYVCMVDMEKLGIKSIEDANIWRNDLMDNLEKSGISTRQGTHAVHTLGYYKNKYGYKDYDLENAYACDKLSIALPLYVTMEQDEQDYVIDKLIEFGRI